MNKITIIFAIAAFLTTGTALAMVKSHPSDEGSYLLDRYTMYGTHPSKGGDRSTSVHPGSEGKDLLSRYEMYKGNKSIARQQVSVNTDNPDSSIWRDQNTL